MKKQNNIKWEDQDLIFDYFLDLELRYRYENLYDDFENLEIDTLFSYLANKRYDVYGITEDENGNKIEEKGEFDTTMYSEYFGLKFPFERGLILEDSKYMFWEENKGRFFTEFLDEYLKKHKLYNNNILSKVKKEIKLTDENYPDEINDPELKKIVKKIKKASERYIDKKVIEMIDEYVEKNSSEYLFFVKKN